MPRAVRQRRPRPTDILEHQAERDVGDELARRQRRTERRLELVQQAYRRMRRADGQPGRCRRPRQRKKLEDRRGDDAERAFGADEQLFQVVAGIILAQSAQAVPHLAARQHHFQPERQFAGVAVAQDLHAARVGRQVAADLAAAFGGQRQREQPAGRRRRFLDFLQDAARFDRDRVVSRIDRANRVHPRQAEEDRAPCQVRNAGAAVARVAALGHDRRTGLSARAHHGRDLGSASRTHDAQCLAAVASPPVAQVRRHVAVRGEHMPGADDRRQRLDQIPVFHSFNSRKFTLPPVRHKGRARRHPPRAPAGNPPARRRNARR